MYEKVVSKGHLDHSYLTVTLEFESCADQSTSTIDAKVFKHIIMKAVKNLFGEVGACVPVDILAYEESGREAVLRVPSGFLNQLWSALSLFGEYKTQRCAFHISQVSGHLMGLAANSRDYVPSTT